MSSFFRLFLAETLYTAIASSPGYNTPLTTNLHLSQADWWFIDSISSLTRTNRQMNENVYYGSLWILYYIQPQSCSYENKFPRSLSEGVQAIFRLLEYQFAFIRFRILDAVNIL